MQVKSPEKAAGISFEEEVWFVLRKIKKRLQYADKDAVVEYRIIAPPYIPTENKPNPIEEAEVLKVLVRWGAVEIVNPNKKPDIAEVSLSKGMSCFITIYSLKILEPRFGAIYKEYEELLSKKGYKIDTDDGLGKEFMPLKWDSKKLEIQWKGKPQDVSRYWAVIKFLNVMSSVEWKQGIELTASDLAECYNELAEQGNSTTVEGYTKRLSSNEAARAADRAIQQLHIILKVTDPEECPIRRRGSVRKGKWRWVQVRHVEARSRKT